MNNAEQAIRRALDAARYQLIRSGVVYIETSDFYAVIGDGPGKYYKDMSELDRDLDHYLATHQAAPDAQGQEDV